MKISSTSKINKYLTAKEYVGGLEISDTSLHFVLFDSYKTDEIILSFESDLEPGIIVKGELKDPAALKVVLLNLRHHPALKKIKNLYVILSLESNTVYYKIFDLPTVDYKSIVSAVELNMRMLSPIPFDRVYSDWELIDKPIKSDSFKLRVFSVFAEKTLVDPYVKVLNEARLMPLAVEFKGLSLIRFFSHYNLFESLEKNYLGIYISANGLEFVLGSKDALEFNFFQTWPDAFNALGLDSSELQKGILTKENFMRVFDDNLQKVITFYFTRFQESIEKVVLVTPLYFDDLANLIQDKYNLNVENPIPIIKEINPGLYFAAGAALRGLIPRVDDVSVSLMAVGTEEEYRRSRTANFLGLWLKVITEVGVFLLLISIGLNVFLSYTKNSVTDDKNLLSIQFDRSHLEELSQQAKEFNANIAQALEAKKFTKDWASVFEAWQQSAENIYFKSLIIPGLETNFSFNGWTISQSEMIKFRDALQQSGYFIDLDIPLQSIIQQKNKVDFNLKGKIKL
ncbi:MAG: hypothetical protein PHF40_02220 [Candidatus Pacebacteria bacterium]|nr:hypothetical protein [Candidatus Paceibacterota bacterium]